ncbi:CYTH domain-containing protein [Halobacillus naozhouensis]|uniref:CYTH domain-containing protein n=1 Tax=Halobacillus naozhouensis TaxID=554880 RepID=A0ABY8J1F0_9BACI|nr:CYTH domain-containing protein [Halobacillus naozhouensis]WFT76180.1 CYTH domain-containing protein [Halobacillus naozhouensis]
MAQEIEIEFKNLLTETEYHTLYTQLEFATIEQVKQTNHYFETDDYKLRDKGAALRIRQKADTWTLTLKEPHPDGLLETHSTLSKETAMLWLENQLSAPSEINRQLEQLGISAADLRYIGALTTKRQEREYNHTLVVLDHSFYCGQSDYELELEARSKQHGEQVFEDILNTFHISKRATDNKIKRFFQAKLKSE